MHPARRGEAGGSWKHCANINQPRPVSQSAKQRKASGWNQKQKQQPTSTISRKKTNGKEERPIQSNSKQLYNHCSNGSTRSQPVSVSVSDSNCERTDGRTDVARAGFESPHDFMDAALLLLDGCMICMTGGGSSLLCYLGNRTHECKMHRQTTHTGRREHMSAMCCLGNLLVNELSCD